MKYGHWALFTSCYCTCNYHKYAIYNVMKLSKTNWSPTKTEIFKLKVLHFCGFISTLYSYTFRFGSRAVKFKKCKRKLKHDFVDHEPYIYNVVEERPQFVVFRLKYVTLYFISITWTALCLQKKDIVQKWPKTSDYLKLWCGMIYFDRRLAVLSLFGL